MPKNTTPKQDRVFTGKHDSYQPDQVLPTKKGGTEFGAWITIPRTSKEHRTEKTTFMAKLGNLDGLIKEKACLDFYRAFTTTPSSRVLLVDKKYAKEILRPFLEFEEGVEDPVLEDILGGYKRYTKPDSREDFFSIFASKKLTGYSDLGEEVIHSIQQEGRPPEFLKIELGDGKVKSVPLYGLMKIAAIAKVLGDTDWLGGSGKNSGKTIKVDEVGTYAEACIVDAGYALDKLTSPSDRPVPISSRDIQIGNMSTDIIEFNKLTENQQLEFISTLDQLTKMPEEELRALFTKNGAYNTDLITDIDMDQWFDHSFRLIQDNLALQELLYQPELNQYRLNKHIKEQIDLARDFFTSSINEEAKYAKNFTSVMRIYSLFCQSKVDNLFTLLTAKDAKKIEAIGHVLETSPLFHSNSSRDLLKSSFLQLMISTEAVREIFISYRDKTEDPISQEILENSLGKIITTMDDIIAEIKQEVPEWENLITYSISPSPSS